MYLIMRTFSEVMDANDGMEIAVVELTSEYLHFLRKCILQAKDLVPLPAEISFHSDADSWHTHDGNDSRFDEAYDDCPRGGLLTEQPVETKPTRTEGGRVVLCPLVEELYWTARHKYGDVTIETVSIPFRVIQTPEVPEIQGRVGG